MQRKHRGLLLGFLLVATFPLMGLDCEGGIECVVPSVSSSDSYYGRFEGTGFDNACSSDADCMVGGCSGEVCAAESVVTTCEALPYGPAGSCGCVEGLCRWAEDTCAECVTDADCALNPNDCDGGYPYDIPCTCQGIPAGSPPPTCSAGTVMCTVDPCLNQVAVCAGGYCEATGLP